jgi:hypothetical protein
LAQTRKLAQRFTRPSIEMSNRRKRNSWILVSNHMIGTAKLRLRIELIRAENVPAYFVKFPKRRSCLILAGFLLGLADYPLVG